MIAILSEFLLSQNYQIRNDKKKGPKYANNNCSRITLLYLDGIRVSLNPRYHALLKPLNFIIKESKVWRRTEISNNINRLPLNVKPTNQIQID